VIFFVYQLIDAVSVSGAPLVVRVAQVTGNEILLLLTILCHELGHGTMARHKGGSIAEVLLWPFGGICFTTRPASRSPREKLVDELWIVAAGPATHFPMAGLWVGLLAVFVAACGHMVLQPAWHHLVPFSGIMGQCVDAEIQGCFQTWQGYLAYMFLVQAVQINVMLFIFNVLFPMYPMDGAKLIVCSLQLFCGVSAYTAAKVLVFTSVPLALVFAGHALLGAHGGGLQPGIMLFLSCMCLAEAYKIHRLAREEQLHTHPLFELAGPQAAAAEANQGFKETQAASQTKHSELRPFQGPGRVLGAASTAV